MKKYTTPKMAFIDLNPADIIATSNRGRMRIIEDDYFEDEESIG